MQKPRLNRCLLCVGRRGTGKTTIALQLAKASGKKICVIDTDSHPSYDGFQEYTIETLHKWRDGNIKIITSDPDLALAALNKQANNAFIICEDAAKYIRPNIQEEVRRFIIDHRKRDFDILFMFHFLQDIPPYLCKQYDVMILFKTGDNLKNQLNKFANWHTIVKKAERIIKNKNFNYCETVAIDE